MPTVSYKWSGKPLSEEQVRSLEEKIGADLPPQYRTFLRKQNGGRPRPAHFEFRERLGDGSIVNFFYAVGASEPSLELEAHAFKRRGVPKDLLEIGNDPGNGPICIGVRGAREGKVYFWAGETPHPAYPDTVGAMLVADSFDEFIDGLHEARDEV